MKRTLFTLGGPIASLAVLLACGEGRAQFTQPVNRQPMGTFGQAGSPLSRPTVSPYINLANRNPVVGYFGIARPQIELRAIETQQQQSIQRLRRQLSDVEVGTADEGPTALPRTGHAAYFMNYSHYYGGGVGNRR